MLQDDELAEFLKEIRHSAQRLVPTLSATVSLLKSVLSNLREECPYLPEIHRLEQKLHDILSMVQEIAREKPTPSG